MIKLGDGFSKKWLIACAVAFAVLLVLPPLLSLTTVNLLTRIFILSVYAMSYDILRGYTGFINLGHALYFGSGAYIAGIFVTHFGNNMLIVLFAVVFAILFSSACAFIMGKVSMRRNGSVLSAAMITLALGEIVRNIAEKWRSVTGGADGLTFRVPALLQNRTTFYYIALIFLVLMILLLRQFTLSPTGRVLLAIRENEQRAEFLGYNTEKYKLIALQVAGISGGLAGLVFGYLNRFANTDLLTLQQTLNALLYTLVGGTGTLYGGVVGTLIVNLIQNALLNLRSVHPIFERWLIFFGAMYIVVVLFMPQGVVGLLQERRTKKQEASKG